MSPYQRFPPLINALIVSSVAVCTVIHPALAQSSDTVIVRDICYDKTGDPKLNSLDIYSPKGKSKCPVVIFIHGGGWQIGDKRGSARGKSEAFPKKGYVFVSINYRLSPDVKHPVLVQDCAKSIAWIQENIAKYGGDPTNLFVMGHSAGAHLAALVSTDEQYLKKEGLRLAALRGTILLDGGSYDMTASGVKKASKDETFAEVFGNDPAVLKSASPLFNVAPGKNIPPFLIIYVASRFDTKKQSEELAGTLAKSGVKADVKPAINKTHETLNKELGNKGDLPTDQVYAFLETVITGKVQSPTVVSPFQVTPVTDTNPRRSHAALNLTPAQRAQAKDLLQKYKGNRENPKFCKEFSRILTPEQREKMSNLHL
ncbi:MAG: alpha/beta hydrolase fold domain-containing protein [Fibrella sp.]|nr:alpha/beta hydrolase fold domain-containing protein [Armatimonadota bacterium]